MEVKYEAGFSRPIIPEGEYKAKFLGVKEITRTEGVDYDRIVLNFEICEGEEAGVQLGRVCGTKCTTGTMLGKFAAAMSGTPLEMIKEGKTIDLGKLEGNVYRVSVEDVIPKKTGEKYSSIGKVYGIVKDEDVSPQPHINDFKALGVE